MISEQKTNEKERKFDLQKNKLFLVTLGIVVVIVVVALVLWRGSVNNLDEATADYSTASSDYETLCKNYNGAPCEALQKAYEADLAALKKQAASISPLRAMMKDKP